MIYNILIVVNMYLYFSFCKSLYRETDNIFTASKSKPIDGLMVVCCSSQPITPSLFFPVSFDMIDELQLIVNPLGKGKVSF
ncbi:MAG: hypothetical protein EHM25_11520 [Nitrosopumilales archaeon]|jgi:hypothetical protein|nr:MAG: hypothetical protein EHM25_11520 [Nitrosopumilales archaeon]